MKTATVLGLAALALAGCYADDPPPAGLPTRTFTSDLSVDIRETAHLELKITGAEIASTITLSKGYGVAPVGEALSGKGSAEQFPEAELLLYTARFDAPADPSGPCGKEPVSLALSLRRRNTDIHLGGSLTAYCGKGVWHGVPARVLRLAGDLL